MIQNVGMLMFDYTSGSITRTHELKFHDESVWSLSIDNMAVARTGGCTGLDLFFDISFDALPLILGQSYVLFKMSGWSWTAPKIGGS